MIAVVPLEPAAVAELARDFVRGRVFVAVDAEDLRCAFPLVLAFADIPPAEAEKIGAVYEYLDKAGPRSINGRPFFTSCRLLHRESLDALRDEVARLEALLAPPEPSTHEETP